MRKRASWLLSTIVLALSVLLVAPASASDSTVTLKSSGPSPKSLSITAGDIVTFSNTDAVSHTISGLGKAFPVAAGETVKRSFPAAGSFKYSDTRNTFLLQSTVGGTIAVTAAPPPSASPKSPPKSSPTSSAKPSTAPSTAPSAAPSPGATVGSESGGGSGGSAVLPQIQPGGGVPSGLPTPAGSDEPIPQVLPETPQPLDSSPEATATSTAAALPYAPKDGLSQSSRHGFGLPTALAVIAIVGVLTVLVRLLLAQPEAGRPAEVRRTGLTAEHSFD